MHNHNYNSEANEPFPPAYSTPVKFGERYSLGGYVAGVILRTKPNTLALLNQRSLILFAEQLVDKLNAVNRPSMNIDEVLNMLFGFADDMCMQTQNHGPLDMNTVRSQGDTAQKICIIFGFFFGYNKSQDFGNNLSRDIWNRKYGNKNQFGLNFQNPAGRELLFLTKSATNLFYQNIARTLPRYLNHDADYFNLVEQVLNDTLGVRRFGADKNELKKAHSSLFNYITGGERV